METTNIPKGRSERFRTIDGLRGIAAASVAILHLGTPVLYVVPAWLPAWAVATAGYGAYGVDVFFVISGFVIAYSVRNGKYSAKYLGLFALRRSIRLDPPYWLAIAAELLLLAVMVARHPTTTFPSTAKILSHLIYAQDLLGYGQISNVAWTLCLEIQFYLLFVGLLVLWEAVRRQVPPSATAPLIRLVLGGLFLLSIAMRFNDALLPMKGLALPRWYEFFLGVMTWWILAETISLRTIVLAYGALAAAVLAYRAAPVELLPIAVSGFIIAVGRARKLDTVLGNAPLQFLGKISYSLYLFHDPIGQAWTVLLGQITRSLGGTMGIGWAWFAFLSGCAIAVGVSTILWRVVEVPSTKFSKRIHLETRSEPSGLLVSPGVA